MIRRQDPDGFYAYPDHRPWWSRLLWRMGFDPLTVRERLAQVDVERAAWKRWHDEAVDLIGWAQARARSALDELGVPGSETPAPVANAVEILEPLVDPDEWRAEKLRRRREAVPA